MLRPYNPTYYLTTKDMIDCFIPLVNEEDFNATRHELKQCALVSHIYPIGIDKPQSSATMKWIGETTEANYTLLYTKGSPLKLGLFALERMVQLAEDSRAGMVYADHYQLKEGKQIAAPVIDYQKGALRDDFDFGSVMLFKTSALKAAIERMKSEYQYAGLYDLRLKLSQTEKLVHINEYLYTEVETDIRKSGEKQFDYVDPRNRSRQIEMEQACTEHLKEIGGYLKPNFTPIDFDQEQFEYEASVIIPVRNRIRTIRDAIRSVLKQQCDFKFNLIVIDNHSTDGTSEAIDEFKADERVIHIIPERYDLGIGGCWNMGVHHPKCGKFAIQLDSDD